MSTHVARSQVPRVRPGVLVLDSSESRLLAIPPGSAQVIVLAGTASDMWRRMDGCLSIDDLADQAHLEYDAPSDVTAKDIEAFVGWLVDLGLLTVGEAR